MMKYILNAKVMVAALVIAGILLCASLAYILIKRPAVTPPDLTPATSDLTIIPAPTSTPLFQPATPTSLLSASLVSPTPAPGQIAIGVYVQVSVDALRIRQEPGLTNDPLFLAFNSEVFRVTKGPELADGYTWWFLTASYDTSRSGWAVQDYLTAIPNP